MDLSMWTAIREYIATEVALAVCRHEHLRHNLDAVERRAWDEQIRKLEEQSTRTETFIRESIESHIHY